MSYAESPRIRFSRLQKSDTALAISKADYVNMMELFNVDPNESSRKLEHAVKSLGGGPAERGSGQKRRREDDISPRR